MERATVHILLVIDPTEAPGGAAAAPAAGFIVAPKTMEVIAGNAPTKIALVAKDSTGKALTGTALAFKSSNEQIATVSPEGEVTGLAKGTAKIEIAAGDQKATTEVIVKAGTFHVPVPLKK